MAGNLGCLIADNALKSLNNEDYMANTQKAINQTCEYRGLPYIRKGQPCTVDGDDGVIFGGNTSANFNVKFDSDGRVRNCHPYWKMKIYDGDKSSVIYEHSD